MRAVGYAFALAGCGRIGFDPIEECRDISCSNVTSNASVRTRLDLDRVAPLGPIDDLPLLVLLDDSRFDRSAARADLADLSFVMDGVILAHEIESTGSPIVAWVRVPTVMSSPIWLYYGSSEPNVMVGSVWADSYLGVWHLADELDSTTKHNDATVVSGAHIPARIGNGLDFPTSSQGYVEVQHGAATTWASGMITLSVWAYMRAQTAAFTTIVARQNGTSARNDFGLGVNNGVQHGEVATTVSGSLLIGDAFPASSWHHFGATFDQSTLQLYLDGVTTTSGAVDGPIEQSANPIHFGADSNDGTPAPESEYVDGVMDEVRIDTVARTPAWMAYDHASQLDGVITYGPIERIPR